MTCASAAQVSASLRSLLANGRLRLELSAATMLFSRVEIDARVPFQPQTVIGPLPKIPATHSREPVSSTEAISFTANGSGNVRS